MSNRPDDPARRREWNDAMMTRAREKYGYVQVRLQYSVKLSAPKLQHHGVYKLLRGERIIFQAKTVEDVWAAIKRISNALQGCTE